MYLCIPGTDGANVCPYFIIFARFVLFHGRVNGFLLLSGVSLLILCIKSSLYAVCFVHDEVFEMIMSDYGGVRRVTSRLGKSVDGSFQSFLTS